MVFLSILYYTRFQVRTAIQKKAQAYEQYERDGKPNHTDWA